MERSTKDVAAGNTIQRTDEIGEEMKHEWITGNDQSRSRIKHEERNNPQNLQEACKVGDLGTVRNLLENGVSIEGEGDGECTPLHYASSAGQLEIVKFLLVHGASVNHYCRRWNGKCTALVHACESGNADIVTILLLYGAEAENEDQWIEEPLHICCMLGHLEAARALISHGVRVDPSVRGRTPLFFACKKGNVELVQLLLSSGAKVNFTYDPNLPLYVACGNGHAEVVNLLLSCGAEVSGNDHLRHPILIACEKGHSAVVQALIGHGALANPKLWKSFTPLHHACRGGSTRIVQLLLANNEEWINYPDGSCRTPLFYACEYGQEEIVDVLLNNGARVDIEDLIDERPMHKACTKGHLEIVRALIGRGARLDADSKSGTPLHYACEGGHYDVVKLLLFKGASANGKCESREGLSPLHLACVSMSSEIVDLLLSNGAEVNIEDNCGRTPLHIACKKGPIYIVRTLLAHGAHVIHENPALSPLTAACSLRKVEFLRLLLIYIDGMPKIAQHLAHPLQQACYFNYIEIVKALLSHGAKVDHPITLVPDPPTGMHLGQYQEAPHNAAQSRSRLLIEEAKSVEVMRILLLHGADVNATYSGDSLLESFSNHADLIRILLDYGAGSGRPCHQHSAYDPVCQKTELMCFYGRREENIDIFDNFFYGKKAAQAGIFEKFFVKKNAAGLARKEENLKAPGDWSEQKRSDFKTQCDAELMRMREQTICNTSATYHDLLTRNFPVLRYQPILDNFNPEDCVRNFPIYGDMAVCSYIQLRRFFLTNQAAAFFSVAVPELLPECAESVMVYLSNEDLQNLVKILH